MTPVARGVNSSTFVPPQSQDNQRSDALLTVAESQIVPPTATALEHRTVELMKTKEEVDSEEDTDALCPMFFRLYYGGIASDTIDFFSTPAGLQILRDLNERSGDKIVEFLNQFQELGQSIETIQQAIQSMSEVRGLLKELKEKQKIAGVLINSAFDIESLVQLEVEIAEDERSCIEKLRGKFKKVPTKQTLDFEYLELLDLLLEENESAPPSSRLTTNNGDIVKFLVEPAVKSIQKHTLEEKMIDPVLRHVLSSKLLVLKLLMNRDIPQEGELNQLIWLSLAHSGIIDFLSAWFSKSKWDHSVKLYFEHNISLKQLKKLHFAANKEKGDIKFVAYIFELVYLVNSKSDFTFHRDFVDACSEEDGNLCVNVIMAEIFNWRRFWLDNLTYSGDDFPPVIDKNKLNAIIISYFQKKDVPLPCKGSRLEQDEAVAEMLDDWKDNYQMRLETILNASVMSLSSFRVMFSGFEQFKSLVAKEYAGFDKDPDIILPLYDDDVMI